MDPSTSAERYEIVVRLTDEDFIDVNEIVGGRSFRVARGMALAGAISGLLLMFVADLPEIGIGFLAAGVFLLLAFSRRGIGIQIRRSTVARSS